MIWVESLVWDDWNRNHIKKHKVTIREIEEACRGKIKSFKSYKRRLIVLGKTKKERFLTILLAPKKERFYYVVTARDMSRKERRLFQND